MKANNKNSGIVRCKNCNFWTRSNPKYKKNYMYGTCSKLEDNNDVISFIIDSGCDCFSIPVIDEVITHENFGCIEGKENAIRNKSN